MGRQRIDLTGKRYGRLTVAHYLGATEGKAIRTYWHCICDCGVEKAVPGQHLREGKVVSCGCGKKKYKAGDRFGDVTLLRPASATEWHAICSCGTKMKVVPWALQHRKYRAMCIACSGRQHRRNDITGVRFDKLTAIRCVGTDKHRNAIWEFVCDCGHVVTRQVNNINKRRERGENSCGVCTELYAAPSVRTHDHLIAKE